MIDEKTKELLLGNGVTTAFVMERLGIRKLTATGMLHKFGANYEPRSGMWRLPNAQRLKNCDIYFNNRIKQGEIK